MSSGRGSYFPKCRKDAQCKCSMCVDSLNATRDLRPSGSSSRRGMLGPLRNALSRAFGSPLPSPGDQRFSNPSLFDFSSPSVSSTARGGSAVLEPVFEEIAAEKSVASSKRDSFPRSRRRWLLWVLAVATAVTIFAEIVAPVILARQFRAHLSPGAVIEMATASRARIRPADRIEFLQHRIQRVFRGKEISNCTGSSTKWTLAEDGALIHSRCRLYSSPAEELSIWGYPIVTAGVLGRRPADRLMFVLAGRVIEWKEGQLDYTIHEEGEWWNHHRWAASVIHLDNNTWIAQYSAGSIDAWSFLAGAGYMTKRIVNSCLKYRFTFPSTVLTIPT
ncbi:uncharacterized protein LOC112341223 [Selaginella moellendorffii]|uniref:uncharacterized protein LOC112341223 n=1 Tax=Selaginella moellendorffii TaxID=88036 RepID=UPI000D1CFCCB|nr:uncharacterized protein LOC112341223 [Selaginella moellendorffii]|eukprot:XP_024516804.1 uncharacterized protein LOC112341223 [Selaginella moellendorffii]